jgi:hypothetical protein
MGNLCQRFVMPAGEMQLSVAVEMLSAEIDVAPDAPYVHQLPDDVLKYPA